MPTITTKQLEDYEILCRDRNNGRILTPDWLRFICEAYHFEAEKIGQHFLEELPRICMKSNCSKDIMRE